MRELLKGIRFGVMEERYLKEQARGKVAEEHREWMEGLVGEALRAKAAVRANLKATVEMRQLGAKAHTRRRGRGVEWGRYCEGRGGRCLKGHSRVITALAECEGRMCSGSVTGRFAYGGWIRWRRSALCQTKTLMKVSCPFRCGRVSLSAGTGMGGCAYGM